MIQNIAASFFVFSLSVLSLGSVPAWAASDWDNPAQGQEQTQEQGFEQGFEQGQAQGQILPVSSLIKGEIKFERRFERRIEACHEGSSYCPPAKTYWTIVVQNQEGKYLLNQRFSAGIEGAPDSLTLNGAVLRPGSIVQISGNTLHVSSSFYLVVDIDSLQLLMD